MSPEELLKLDECPCELCTSQDDEETLLERERLKELDEVCDMFSNEIIDLIIENPRKYLLKQQNKQDNVK